MEFAALVSDNKVTLNYYKQGRPQALKGGGIEIA